MFVKYEKPQSLGAKKKSTIEPRLTISQSGVITINKKARTDLITASGAEAFMLFFDREANRLGLKPTAAGDNGSAKANESKTGCVSFHAGRALKAFGIQFKGKTTICTPEFAEGMIVVSLDTAITKEPATRNKPVAPSTPKPAFP